MTNVVTRATAIVLVTAFLDGVSAPVQAVPSTGGTPGAPVPISYAIDDPEPEPPGCEPDSPDPTCQPEQPCICGGLPGARRNCIRECQRRRQAATAPESYGRF